MVNDGMNKKLVVIGSSNVDTVIRVPHIPAVGETIMAREVQLCYGGKGANQAVAIARLGGDIALISCIGDDELGQLFLRALNEYGVETGAVELLLGIPTGTAYINVADHGDNNIVVNAGANSHVTSDMVERHRNLLDGAAYCIIQLEIPLPTLYFVAKLCRELGIRLILNPAPAAKLDFESLKGSWMIAPNESELELLIPGDGDTFSKARALHQEGFEHVIVTLGPKGCLHVSDQGESIYPAYDVFPVKDTTAAGDSFIGALAFGLSRGCDLESSIELANKAASITVSRAGAQQSLPALAEIESVFGSVL